LDPLSVGISGLVDSSSLLIDLVLKDILSRASTLASNSGNPPQRIGFDGRMVTVLSALTKNVSVCKYGFHQPPFTRHNPIKPRDSLSCVG